jgi:SAM-dependent methyltransferase
LDWGCGKGHVSYLLQKQGLQVISCDVMNNSGDSAYGQTVPIIDTFGINIVPLTHPYQLPFNDNSMDIVLSFGVLEHVTNDLASLQEIERILKPNGLFFCFDLPYVLSWTQKIAHMRGNYYHDRLYSRKSICQLLNLSGLSLLDFWHRQLLPKNSIRYVGYRFWETVDQVLTEYTPLRYFATNIEFVAVKGLSKSE